MNSSGDFHENSFSRFDKFLRLVAQIIASNFEPEYTRARSTAKPSAAEYDSSVVYRGCHVSAEMTSEDKQSKVMSETDYQQLIERMLENAASPTISSDTGVEAAQKVGELAAREEIEWAVAGGLAMYFYGSPRLTKDVDIIASQNLSLTPKHRLSFGGSSYTLQVGKFEVQVDWIVRNDGFHKYYRAALKDAINLPNGIRVVTPEWLVILKFKAGRQKDLDDIVFLLKQQKMVDRSTIKQKVIETGGEDAWMMMMAGFRRLCDLADGKTTEPSKYYDQE